MNKRPFISVVMPVYNVEKHLEKAVSGILDQSLQDFEIILVDDCSPDGCPALCDRIAASDPRIRAVHHTENQGLSMARNTGMDQAAGQYIWFMDSDDYVEADLFECAAEALKDNPAEITVFGLTEDYYDPDDRLHHSKEILPEEKKFRTRQELREYVIELERQTLYGYAWNKFYDLDYLKKIGLRFEKITLIEDILFNVKYCMDIQKMNILPFSGYHYNKRMDQSLTSKFVPEYYKLHRMRISLLRRQYEYWNMYTDSVKSILGALYTRYVFSAVQRNCDPRSEMNHASRIAWTKRLLREPLVNELIPYADSEGVLLKVLIQMLRGNHASAVVALGRLIYVCKSRLPMLFSVLKQKR